MSSTWFIYSGALMVLLSIGVLILAGRPATPVRRDATSVASGVVIFAAVCALALLLHAPAHIAVSGACFWMAAAITAVHAVRGRSRSQG
ncbi:hypothetical protein OG302_20115 [Streptomyces sp. NBC_01283]|uniref:hypothetical protein n=1 Tax=Streptomyces sp. NBC_01283 TaxID=2903812 RepID=UPI00352CDDA4|nr:hypothetical protein OG302_20115 [Streptomyces sp. NBC_01283]